MRQLRSILHQSFPLETSGYLAIIEIPLVFELWYEVSENSLEELHKKIRNCPYWCIWEVRELRKMGAWVEAMLKSSDCEAEMFEYENLPSEVQKLIIQDVTREYEERFSDESTGD